jgi:hypothetical protein
LRSKAFIEPFGQLFMWAAVNMFFNPPFLLRREPEPFVQGFWAVARYCGSYVLLRFGRAEAAIEFRRQIRIRLAAIVFEPTDLLMSIWFATHAPTSPLFAS